MRRLVSETNWTLFSDPLGSELFLSWQLNLHSPSRHSEVEPLLCVCGSLCSSELQTDGFSDSSICVAPAVWSTLPGPRRAPQLALYVNRIIMLFTSIDERARRAEVRSCGGDGLHLHPVRWVGAASRHGGQAPSLSCRWPHVESERWPFHLSSHQTDSESQTSACCCQTLRNHQDLFSEWQHVRQQRANVTQTLWPLLHSAHPRHDLQQPSTWLLLLQLGSKETKLFSRFSTLMNTLSSEIQPQKRRQNTTKGLIQQKQTRQTQNTEHRPTKCSDKTLSFTILVKLFSFKKKIVSGDNN